MARFRTPPIYGPTWYDPEGQERIVASLRAERLRIVDVDETLVYEGKVQLIVEQE